MSRIVVEARSPRPLPARSTVAMANALLLALGGCEGIVDVDNPNTVVQGDLETPAAAGAVVNGALTATSRALGYMARPHSATTDELVWRGSFDYVGQHDRGELWNDDSGFVVLAFNNLSLARWLSDEAIKLLEGFDADGTLGNQDHLARAYLLSAINYATAADNFENFVLSDRQNVAPPVGRQNMHTLYDVALQRLERAEAVANATGNNELQLAVLGWRARVYWARALWNKLSPRQTPADPLIDDAQANAAAAQLLQRASPDWRYQFRYSGASSENWLGNWVNSRLEMTFDSHLAQQDGSGRKICSPHNAACPQDGIVLRDPIDDVQDPALRRYLWEFIEGFVFPPLTGVSAREMQLILAEAALKRGETAAFATHINSVRALEAELTPYDPAVHAVDPVALLVHARKVNLFLQVQRRLGDMYRFGVRSPRWIDTAEAVRSPGTMFPMSRTENISNCYVVGTCG